MQLPAVLAHGDKVKIVFGELDDRTPDDEIPFEMVSSMHRRR
jgi:hypothetical protein